MMISNKLKKADDSLTINKLDNGYMVEVSGRDEEDDWASAKILVLTLQEVFDLLEEYADMEVI
jgi:hypothetical protein